MSTTISTPRLIVAVVTAAVLSVLVLDPLVSEITFVPFLLGFALVVLAFRLPPWRLGIWCGIFSLLVLLSLMRLEWFYAGDAMAWLRLFLRLGVFLSSCALAILLSITRARHVRIMHQQMETMVRLPVPLVVANGAGAIIFASDEALALLRLDRAEVLNANFPALFMTDLQEGDAMRLFIELMEDQQVPVKTLELSVRGLPDKVPAKLLCFGFGKDRRAVCVLLPGEPLLVPPLDRGNA